LAGVFGLASASDSQAGPDDQKIARQPSAGAQVKSKNSTIGSILLWLSPPEEAFITSDEDGRRPKMSPGIQNQIARSKEQALAAFVSKKIEIDTMLARLQALSDDHFGYSPDEITWDPVGTLGYYAELLKRVTDSAFREGEHAE
jgi:hypothetical protein